MSRSVLSAYSLHALRALALVLTCVASGTFVLYTTNDPWLSELDVWLEDQRFGKAHKALQAALQPGADPAQAKAEFERLRIEFQGYRHGDRQEAIWMYATLMRAHQSQNAAEMDKALELVTELRQSRPQELMFHFFYADLLRATGDNLGSDQVLDDLFQRLPEHDEVARRTAQAALQQQRWLQAGLTLTNHLRKPPSLDFEATFETADQDPGVVSLQRCSLLMKLDATGQLSARFAVPAGAARVELEPPLGVQFQLHAPHFVGDLPPGTTQSPSANPSEGAAPADSSDIRPALEFAQPLAASLELQFIAGLTYRFASWLQAILVSPAIPVMHRALMDADCTEAAASLTLYRRFALLSQPQTLSSAGPDGATEHACQLRGGWPDPDRIQCCLVATIEQPVTSLEVAWPLSAQTPTTQLPRLQTTPDSAPPRIARDKDRVRFEWSEAQQIDRVLILGELQR